VTSPLRTAAALPAVCVLVGLSAVCVPAAQAEDGMHHVRYTVTSDNPEDVEIYYRDTDPPDWAGGVSMNRRLESGDHDGGELADPPTLGDP
jgi:hypothetical protein